MYSKNKFKKKSNSKLFVKHGSIQIKITGELLEFSICLKDYYGLYGYGLNKKKKNWLTEGHGILFRNFDWNIEFAAERYEEAQFIATVQKNNGNLTIWNH